MRESWLPLSILAYAQTVPMLGLSLNDMICTYQLLICAFLFYISTITYEILIILPGIICVGGDGIINEV